MKYDSGFCLILLTGLLLVACSTPNTNNGKQHLKLASQAEDAGDYALARKHYETALNTAEQTGSREMRSLLAYNLGRMHGYLCDFGQAEHYLRQSLNLEEQQEDENPQALSMALFELARLHYDRQQYPQALPYYKRGIILLEQMDIESSDPIAFAEVLDEYAVSLDTNQEIAAAKATQQKAQELREAYPKQKALFKPVRYTVHCE